MCVESKLLFAESSEEGTIVQFFRMVEREIGMLGCGRHISAVLLFYVFGAMRSAVDKRKAGVGCFARMQF